MDSKIAPGSKLPPTQRIVDRLDLQLLVAVIVFFVSAWIFLNGKICRFTESEPIGVQLGYMFVHYILTLFLFLCIVITAIKGFFVLKETEDDLSQNSKSLLRFFIEGWLPALLLCVLILVISMSETFWYWGFVLAIALLFFELSRLRILLPYRLCILLGFIILFPVFISSMTLVVRNMDIVVDKEYYSASDDVVIMVQSQGYACNHTIVKLREDELYPNTKPLISKNTIVVPASCVKNNVISVGTICPASGGFNNFIMYPYRKIFGIKMPIQPNPKGIYYKSKTILVK